MGGAVAGSIEGLSHQPDRVTGLYRGEPPEDGCALVEMAGRDSVAAAVVLAREGGLKRALPTVAYTGTEYGDVGALLANVERLRRLVEPLGVEVMEPVVLGSPLWWRATIGRVNTVLARLYGPWHICVGCHMYLHAVRAPLAWETGIVRQVGGERPGHQGKIKINQTRPAVEAYGEVLAGSGSGWSCPCWSSMTRSPSFPWPAIGGRGRGSRTASCPATTASWGAVCLMTRAWYGPIWMITWCRLQPHPDVSERRR